MNTASHYGISRPLTIAELVERAPAIAATEPSTTVSSRYRFISTQHVLEALISNGLRPYAVQQSRSNKEHGITYAKHLIRFRAAETEFCKVGDNFPELVILNSHNGLSSYRIYVGVFRLICTNGLIVSDGTVISENIRHTHDVIQEVIAATGRAVQRFPSVADTITQWQGIHLTMTQQRNLALSALGLRWDVGQSPILPEALLVPRRYDDHGDDLWRIYNRIQENLERGGIRYSKELTTRDIPRRNTTRRITGIDAKVRLNTKLWQLAASYT